MPSSRDTSKKSKVGPEDLVALLLHHGSVDITTAARTLGVRTRSISSWIKKLENLGLIYTLDSPSHSTLILLSPVIANNDLLLWNAELEVWELTLKHREEKIKQEELYLRARQLPLVELEQRIQNKRKKINEMEKKLEKLQKCIDRYLKDFNELRKRMEEEVIKLSNKKV